MEFNELKAEEYCDSVRDGTHDSPKQTKEGYKLITSKHIKENEIDLESAYYISKEDYEKVNQRSKVDINDILYSMIGTVGLIYRVKEEPNYAIKNMGLFKLKDELKSKWLYYYLKSPKMISYIQTLLTGSTQKYVTLKNLRELPIKYPKDNQLTEKIIKFLENIDRKIELNNKINDNLLKLNNQLYEEYFINNIDEKTNEVYLKDLIKVVNGYSYKGSELVDNSNIGLATIKNFERKGGFKEDGFKPLNPQKIKEEQIAENNDILVACTDLTQQADIIGNAVLLLGKAEYEKIIISMDLVKIIPNESIDKYIIFSILNSREFKNFALGYKSGTTVLHLNKKCFDDFVIKLPNNDKLDIFSEMIKTNYEKISNIIEENRRLEKLRDTLLPKLMNGEIDLDKIEI